MEFAIFLLKNYLETADVVCEHSSSLSGDVSTVHQGKTGSCGYRHIWRTVTTLTLESG